MATGSRSVVVAALVANLAIALVKLGGFVLTGSPSMLSEAYHSFSDTGNQVLLLVGLTLSGRKASQSHPFGWGKAEFFYAFVVAMLLFGIAGWESLRHGLEGLLHPSNGPEGLFGQVHLLGLAFSSIWINYAILAAAFVFEGYAFRRALGSMRESMRRGRYRSLWHTFRETKQAAVLTAFSEDLLALTGLVVAAAALALTHVTGDPRFDAAGALVIGTMLMGFALLLAWEHQRLLVGEAMEPWQEEEIRALVLSSEGVTGCRNLRTVFFGASYVLLTADVVFEEDLPAARVEDVVDELEARIRERFSRIRAVYLEADVDERE